MNAAEQPLVYVLTPVYNGEKYLAECIESVLAQTYQNWEYCILNNRSTDSSREIAEAYAKKDQRISVRDTSELLNHLANHNLGLCQIPAGSRYCKVVHADDWLFPECLTKMVEIAESNPKISLVGAYGLRNVGVSWGGVAYNTSVMEGRSVCRRTLLGGPYVFGTPTSLLIRADEVRKRPNFYNESNPHADMEVCFDILRDGDFGFVHQVLTFTRDHSEADPSGTKSLHTRKFGDLLILVKFGRAHLSEEEYADCIKRCWSSYYTLIGQMILRNRSKQFWSYHRTALKNLGYDLSWPNVAAAVGKEFIDVLLNPLNTSVRIVNRIGRAKAKSRMVGNDRTGGREQVVSAD